MECLLAADEILKSQKMALILELLRPLARYMPFNVCPIVFKSLQLDGGGPLIDCFSSCLLCELFLKYHKYISFMVINTLVPNLRFKW